jgi:hypothetical protein
MVFVKKSIDDLRSWRKLLKPKIKIQQLNLALTQQVGKIESELCTAQPQLFFASVFIQHLSL